MPARNRLDIGNRAPAEIALRNQHGEELRLEDFRGRHQVLFFYPADDTPGCTVEGKGFRDLYEQFGALDCVVIGVSVDSVESHRAFADKHGLPFHLLSDPEGLLAAEFGVMGDRVAQRSTFVLDPDLRIRRRIDEVKPRGHAQQVLEFVRALQESHRMLGG
ncbi:MAG: peroxiredoxin [Candidatus Binataceae bacterium]